MIREYKHFFKSLLQLCEMRENGRKNDQKINFLDSIRTAMIKTFKNEIVFAIENASINISCVQLILHYVLAHAQTMLVQKCRVITFNLQRGCHIIIE